MTNTLAYKLADIAALAQQEFQQAYRHIDPIIGINSQMRSQGFAMDIITIDCNTSKKRITLLLEDAKPESAGYQFGSTNKDPQPKFESIGIDQLSQQGFYQLMCRGLASEG